MGLDEVDLVTGEMLCFLCPYESCFSVSLVRTRPQSSLSSPNSSKPISVLLQGPGRTPEAGQGLRTVARADDP